MYSFNLFTLPRAVNCVRFCFGAVCVFLFVYEISRDRWTDLNQIHTEDMFGPSLGRVEGQGHRSKVKVTRDQNRNFSARPATCVRFMFCETSLASSFSCICTTRSELRKVLFLAPPVFVFCLCMKYLGNRWTDLRQIHMKDMFGSSLGWVLRSRSRSKIKVTRENK